ncbi:hypothetical protein [Cohnella sp. GbtcB17]|uniref:hypothetical protein n=1 Tax=Cohnella sp. GbtcB17 TaxID=2824762 RepID=UPI001C2FDDFF|nr:hypothetical protein [Cohnella sp. GbtcB17]
MAQPNETSNAKKLSVVCSSVHPVIFFRHEALVEYLSEEPQFINVKKDLQDDILSMEQVLRIRKWSKEGITSWQIFSGIRDFTQSNGLIPIIIRKLIWQKDHSILENITSDMRKRLLQDWPEVVISNIYVQINSGSSLLKSLQLMDLTTTSGINLSDRKQNLSEWTHIELMRLYEWGKLNLTWSSQKQHQELEELIKLLTTELSSIQETQEVFEMVHDFSITPEDYRKIVTGI